MEKPKDLIEQQYLTLAKEQAVLFQSCGVIMSSDHGESLVKLINALCDGFKDRALFVDDEKERLVMRGAVVSLQTLLSQMAEFATRDADIGQERDVRVPDMVPSYASVEEDEELS